VLARRPVGQRRRHHDVVPLLGEPVREGGGDRRVGADREVRPVLLGGPDRYRQERPGGDGGRLRPAEAFELPQRGFRVRRTGLL
jgi:hypothetical protein